MSTTDIVEETNAETERPPVETGQAERNAELNESVRMLSSLVEQAVTAALRKQNAPPVTQVMPATAPMSSSPPMCSGFQNSPGQNDPAQVTERDKMPEFANAFQFGKYATTPVVEFLSIPRLTPYIVKELNLSNLNAEQIEQVQLIASIIRDCVLMGDTVTAESYFFDMMYILLPSRSAEGLNLGLLSTSKIVNVLKDEEGKENEKPKKLFR